MRWRSWEPILTQWSEGSSFYWASVIAGTRSPRNIQCFVSSIVYEDYFAKLLSREIKRIARKLWNSAQKLCCRETFLRCEVSSKSFELMNLFNPRAIGGIVIFTFSTGNFFCFRIVLLVQLEQILNTLQEPSACRCWWRGGWIRWRPRWCRTRSCWACSTVRRTATPCRYIIIIHDFVTRLTGNIFPGRSVMTLYELPCLS